MENSSSSPCDDILWSLENCTVPNADPCCFPRAKATTIGDIRATAFVILGIVGILGNTLNVVALPYARRLCRDVHSPLRHSTTILVIGLSVCDLLFCICYLTNATTSYTRGWPYGQVSCTVVAYIMHVANTCSFTHLWVMAINRGVGVWFPHVCNRIFDSMNSLPPILAMWVFSIAHVSMHVHSETFGYLGYNPEFGYCTFVDTRPIGNLYKYVVTAFNFAMPIICIVISSVAIYVKMWQSRKRVQTSGSASSDVLLKRERKLTVIFSTISAIYIVCATPFVIIMLHLGLNSYENPLHFVAGICYALNFTINFIVYAVRVPAYRAAYLLFFGRVAEITRSSKSSLKKNYRLISEGLVSVARRISSSVNGSNGQDKRTEETREIPPGTKQ